MRLALIPLLLELVLTGCGSPRSDAAADRRALVVAFGADEFPLTTNRERLGRYPLNAGICEPLVRLTRDFMVAPALAVRWERHETGAVRFILQSGVTFSNGAPVDARAVAYTLARVARTRTDFSFLADSSVRVVDDTTLDVRPARMNRRLVEQLVHQIYDILAPGSDPARQPDARASFVSSASGHVAVQYSGGV